MELLFIVEDVFVITGRDSVVVTGIVTPDPLREEQKSLSATEYLGLSSFFVTVCLRLPDGTERIAEAQINSHLSMSQAYGTDSRIMACWLKRFEKHEIPRGTEVWLLPDTFDEDRSST